MSLFPSLLPAFQDEKDRGILSKMEAFYANSISINQAFWSEAMLDTRFEAGDAQLWNQLYGGLQVDASKRFNFNKIRKVVNMIGGYQRKNRKSIIVVPIENGDEETAEQFTKILMWSHNQDGVLETVSDSFHGALVTGMNLLQVWLDFRSDPVSGNLKIDNCSYNSFLIDPYFKKADLSDCNGIWKRSFVTKNQCVSLLPDHAEEICSLSATSGASEGKFQFLPENFNFDRKDLLTYDEFYYRDFREQTVLVDSDNGMCYEWKRGSNEDLQEFLDYFPQIEVLKQVIPTVRLAVVVQGKVFYDDVNPLGIDLYPFVPVFGYYSPQMANYQERIQGVVRGLRDSQFLYNRHRVLQLDIVESQVNSGWVYKENALVNPRDVFLQGQGKGLALKASAQMTDVQKIPPADIPASLFQNTEILDKEFSSISGVNEELLGSAVDDKAGVLAMLRQGAGLTTLQILFDQLDRSLKLLGKLEIEIIQNNFTVGKVARVLNEEPTEQFYNRSFGTYDSAVEEGLNTTTQRQMQFAQLIQLRELGVPITDEDLVESATMQGKKDIKERMNKEKEQQQQAQQMQLQSEMQEQQARTNLANARATADEGLGIERLSRVEENKALAVEREAEASKDRDQALLNFVKALKEMEDIDIMQLEKLINLSTLLEDRDKERFNEDRASQATVGSPQESVPENTSLRQQRPQGLSGDSNSGLI